MVPPASTPRPGPASSSFLRDAIVVGIGVLGSRLLGLLRNVLIGHLYGTAPELDAYFAAFRLPDLLFQLLAGAALAGAFLPTYTELFTRHSKEAAARLASSLLVLVGGLTALLAALVFLFAPWLVPLTVPGYSSEIQQLTVALTRLMLLSPCFFSLSGLLTGVLQGHQRFLLPAFASWAYNGAIIAAALLFSGALGVHALAWGAVVGAALHLAVQVPGLLQLRVPLRPALDLRDHALHEVLRLAGPRMLGLAAAHLNFVVTTVLASFLPSGSLAALNYAWAVLMLPVGLFGMSLATTAFPSLAQQAALQGPQGLRPVLAESLRAVLALMLPAAVGLAFLAPGIVGLLFQRGFFDEASVELTAAALIGYAVGLPAHGALEVLSRGFYALRDTKTPFLLGAASLLLHILLGLVLMRPLHVAGLALALSLASLFEALASGLLLHQRTRLWQAALLPAMSHVLLGSAGVGLALYLLRAFLPMASPLLLVLVGVPLGVAVYTVLAFREVRALLARVL